MNRSQLIEQVNKKNSYLCVGLDTDLTKIPKHLLDQEDPVFSFNKAIIDATREYCVCYKINTAFYEALGVKGWAAMEKTVHYIGNDHFKIADAKRGDIGNTSDQYAKAFFQTLPFDAVTVAPYMGKDSIEPFLQYENKWAIVLGLTSNTGASDFELQSTIKKTGEHSILNHTEALYEKVLRTVSEWGTIENLMFVVGASQAKHLESIRQIIPDHFLLVPGVGAQGGSLADTNKYGRNKDGGLLVNLSRAIIYASKSENFAEEAGKVAAEYALEMKKHLEYKN